jgi:hypothetical protein
VDLRENEAWPVAGGGLEEGPTSLEELVAARRWWRPGGSCGLADFRGAPGELTAQPVSEGSQGDHGSSRPGWWPVELEPCQRCRQCRPSCTMLYSLGVGQPAAREIDNAGSSRWGHKACRRHHEDLPGGGVGGGGGGYRRRRACPRGGGVRALRASVHGY